MKKSSKILSVLLMVSMLFILLGNTVSATSLEDLMNQLNQTTGDNTQAIENIADNNVAGTNNTVVPVNNTVNNTTNNTSANETLPKTGITEDYAIIAFATICIGSTIYAYKKVKNYNVK